MQQNYGRFNRGKYSPFYCTECEIKHVPLTKWERSHFYSRSQTKRLARHGIISLIRYKKRFYVAVFSDYADYPVEDLLDLL